MTALKVCPTPIICRHAAGVKPLCTYARTRAPCSQNATCTTQWDWGTSTFPNRWCATQIFTYTYANCRHSIVQSQWHAKDGKQNEECVPNLLIEGETATGLYTVYCMVLQLTSSLQTSTAYSANPNVKTIIARNKHEFWVNDDLQLPDTLKYIRRIYLYLFVKSNVVIKEKVHEDDRMAATTPLVTYYVKSNGCILWIHPWKNERQWRINNFWSCKSGN